MSDGPPAVAGDGPLKGLRVVELARILAGPWIGQTLADLGAEVIKIEAPEGDDTRRWGPPFLDRARPDGGTERVAAYFHAANRGKTSITCDFGNPDDLARLRDLIATADVVVENFRPGVMARLGLDARSYDQKYYGPAFKLLEDPGACDRIGPTAKPLIRRLIQMGGGTTPLTQSQ